MKLPAKKVPVAGVVQAWRAACGKDEKWNGSLTEREVMTKPLKFVRCPECLEEHKGKDLKLRAKFGFSNLKCQACNDVTIAVSWRC